MEEQRPCIVVGVVPGQPMTVVAEAAVFAAQFDAELVCASVDASRYAVSREADGTVVSMPLDSDLVDDAVEEFDAELSAAISNVLGDKGVQWSTRALAGGPANELAKLAETINAVMIVVGTRNPGIRGSLHEYFSGSVAAQLAHRQHRPVVVVPLNPVGLEGELPWENDE